MHARMTLALLGLGSMVAMAQQSTAPQATRAGTALTIYNQGFAVVRAPVELRLQAGTTEVKEEGVTSMLEPDSVVLRDPSNRRPIVVLEQNYDSALAVQAQMLRKFEGRTIDFQSGYGPGVQREPGRIVRAGTVPQFYQPSDPYGQDALRQEESLVEVNGKLQFGLPGLPLFPADEQGLTLRSTLRWLIASDRAARVSAELDYITRGLQWSATYNLIAPAEDKGSGDRLEMVGWVNVTNSSGTDFKDAKLQLMAGDVSKLTNGRGPGRVSGGVAGMVTQTVSVDQPQITQKSFDEYHLYDLRRTATLLDRESKQIEFLHGMEIPAERVYVYDGGSSAGRQPYQWNQPNGAEVSNKKVWTMQDFKNSETNHLGMPLPAGRMRFYRRDVDGSLQFIGENTIDHTPKDETVRVYLGNAFDLTGDRVQTNFKNMQAERRIVESFRITLRNAKEVSATVRAVESMYRGANWEISQNSDAFVKKDSRTVEFSEVIPAHGERSLTYTVTYSW